MYKSMTLLVLVALAACVVAMEAKDQQAAEQYYQIHGVYPQWYTYSTPSYTAVKSYPYVSFGGYPNVNPIAYTAGIKNVAAPYYAAYPYAYQAYPYAAPFTFYSTPGAPYVAPAAPEAPAKV